MTPNLIEVTLTPEQLKQLTDERKLTVSVRVPEPQGFGLSGALLVTLRINKEDDGRAAVTRSSVWELKPDDALINCSCGKPAKYGRTSNGGAPFFYECSDCFKEK